MVSGGVRHAAGVNSWQAAAQAGSNGGSRQRQVPMCPCWSRMGSIRAHRSAFLRFSRSFCFCFLAALLAAALLAPFSAGGQAAAAAAAVRAGRRRAAPPAAVQFETVGQAVQGARWPHGAPRRPRPAPQAPAPLACRCCTRHGGGAQLPGAENVLPGAGAAASEDDGSWRAKGGLQASGWCAIEV